MTLSNRLQKREEKSVYRPTLTGTFIEIGAMIAVSAGVLYAIVNAPRSQSPDTNNRPVPGDSRPESFDKLPRPELRPDGYLC